MPYPSFSEVLGSKSAVGIAKETVFRTPVTATAFTPFDSCTIDEDPGTYAPPTMIGVISTDVYPMQGEVKVAGGIKGPLYATNGVPMLIGSIGQDAIAFNGTQGIPVIASAGTPGSAGTSTSFAATGVTSVALTGITGTFAVNQAVYIKGSTDTFDGGEVCSVSAFSTPTLTISATTKIHTGTITVVTCGAVSSGGISAAGTTITLAAGMGALFTSNDIVMVDINGTTTTSEVRKVTKAGDVLTIVDASPYAGWGFAHLTAVTVVNVTAQLWGHTIPSGNLDSFTLEKNIGGVQSLIHPGVRFAKGSLSCPGGNTTASMSIDALGAAQPTVQASPTSATTTTESPYMFAEGVFTFGGVAHPEAYNAKIDWDNVMKPTTTYSGSRYPSFVTKTDFHVTGSFDAVFQNFNDSANGFWTKADVQTQGALLFTLTHASDGSIIKVNLPLVVVTKTTIAPTVGNVVTQNCTFKAFYGLSTATANMVLTVWNKSRYLPY